MIYKVIACHVAENLLEIFPFVVISFQITLLGKSFIFIFKV